ncbi:Bromodomain-containing protein, partial [Violaceomyces palustris]
IKITPAQIKFAQNSIKALKSRREAQPFLQPVDPIAQGVPHYPQVIAHPMDLGTVDIKLALTALAVKPGGKPGEKAKQAPQWGLDPERDFYASVEEFESDVLLIFSNCALFNGKESPYTANAMVLQAAFERHMKDIPSAAAPAAPPATIIREAVAGEPKRESRRPSNPVPTIRRSSSDAGGRPKREIHPPPPKDLPWATEPASATVSGSKKMQGKKGSKKGGVLTPREQAHYAKIAQDELKFCARVVEELLKSHYNDAWVFEELPTRDYDWAPAYYEIIKNPVALGPVQRNLKANKYPDAASFDADIQQMFSNCFTFNPPGSDVYLMGERLKKVYDEKMSRKPIPPAYSPEPEYTSEDDDNEDDDVDSEFIKKLGQQIADMQETLAKLEGAKNQNHDLIANTKAMLAAFQANYASSKPEKKSKGAKRKGVPDGGLVGQGSSKKKAKSKVSGNSSQDDTYQAKKSKPAASKAPQKKKSSGGGTSSKKSSASKRNAGSDDEIRTVTYEQKEELAAKITELSEERLDGAIRIINEDKPPNQSEEEEIELDIDELSPRTLYKLYKYVVRPSKKPSASASANKGNGRNSAPLDGRKRGTGGLKKKNLDEGEEAERIARLQQQLEQFGNHDGGIPGSSAPAGIHDDLVQSESSSDGESGSDSESD